MKTDNGHIDEILKQQFEHFAPDAPDVWEAVSQGVQQVALQSATTTIAAKTITTATKLWTAIVGVAAVATTAAILLVNSGNDKQTDYTPVNSIEQASQAELLPQKEESVELKQATTLTTKPINEHSTKLEKESKTSSNELVNNHHQPESENHYTGHNPSTQTQPQSTNTKPELKAEQARQEPAKPQQTQVAEPEKRMVEKPSTILPDPLTQPDPVIPNIFTPNNDGLNDAFVIDIPDVANYAIKIFSPRNQVVYESSNIAESWNGTNMQNGENCEEGIYAYVLHYQTNTGASRTLRGKVKLVR
jgi:gliding motility-associated-like protein